MKITTIDRLGLGLILAGGTLAVLLLSGCSDPVKTRQVVAVLCAQDAILQPLTSAVVSVTGPAEAAAATSESLLVHPEVLAACAAENAVPVAVVAPPAPAAVTAPAVTAPTK